MIPGSRLAGFVVNAAAWVTVQALAGYAVHRLPDRALERDGALLRERAWEQGGRFYERVLRVRRWQRRLPQARSLFPPTRPSGPIGPSGKARAAGRRPGTDEWSLRAAIRETRRAELGHWLALAALPVFVLWNPPRGLAYVSVYAVAANVPCIVSQRHTRLRLTRLLTRRVSRR